jgi:stage V sporulation protein B
MEKSKFLTSTIILMIGATITKILGMIIKIITTRYVGLDGIGIYMLIIPTFTLFINIAVLGFPVAISKLVAEDKNNNKSIIFSAIPIAIMLNIILLFIILTISPIISSLLLDKRTLYPLMSIGFVLPFISLSSIVRGYFFGKEKMIPHTISHIIEQITRLILIIITVPILLQKSLEAAISGIVLVNILSELASIIILLFYMPKKTKITKKDIMPNRKLMRDVLNIGVPTTGSRIIGSIGYFLEPFILGYILMKVGYSSLYIVTQYGILNGYVFPLLMIPSFFIQTIGTALIPIISKGYANNNIKYIRQKLKQGIIFSLLIGTMITAIIMINPALFLKLIYDTTAGTEYLKIMCPFFIVYYLQVPLTATLQAINRAKEAMMSTFWGMIIKIALIFGLSLLKIGLYSLIIATIVNIFIVTIYNYIKVKKALAFLEN